MEWYKTGTSETALDGSDDRAPDGASNGACSSHEEAREAGELDPDEAAPAATPGGDESGVSMLSLIHI